MSKYLISVFELIKVGGQNCLILKVFSRKSYKNSLVVSLGILMDKTMDNKLMKSPMTTNKITPYVE